MGEKKVRIRVLLWRHDGDAAAHGVGICDIAGQGQAARAGYSHPTVHKIRGQAKQIARSDSQAAAWSECELVGPDNRSGFRSEGQHDVVRRCRTQVGQTNIASPHRAQLSPFHEVWEIQIGPALIRGYTVRY